MPLLHEQPSVTATPPLPTDPRPLTPAEPPTADWIEAEMVAEGPVITAELAEEAVVAVDSNDLPLDAEVLYSDWIDRDLPPARSWPVRFWRKACGSLEWLFGLASLIGILAVVSTIPLVQMLSLGYLLEASGRVARKGRLRDGFIGMHLSARIGSMVLGTWLMLWPLRLLAAAANDAYLIDPGSPAAGAWRIGQFVATGLIIAHILLAWYSGGKLRHFFWPLLAPFYLVRAAIFFGVIGPVTRPILTRFWPSLAEDLFTRQPLDAWFPPAVLWSGLKRGRVIGEARDAVWDFALRLRLPYYFWLGFRGFVGALVWLAIPVGLLIVGTAGGQGIHVIIGYVGAFLLTAIFMYLPFLQTHFACQNRLAAMFEWRQAREYFRRAPVAFWIAIVVTLLFTLPLYLLKIELTPRQLTWLPSLFFVLFIYPARLLTGWAVGRAMRRERPRHFLVRSGAWLTVIPLVLIYVGFMFLTQYLSWNGYASLFEQHAFLVPAPFLSL
jgi:hypothetical protein